MYSGMRYSQGYVSNLDVLRDMLGVPRGTCMLDVLRSMLGVPMGMLCVLRDMLCVLRGHGWRNRGGHRVFSPARLGRGGKSIFFPLLISVLDQTFPLLISQVN